MAQQKIAVVTGSNKGIGYAIVKGLCDKFDGAVYLTARDVSRGQAAVVKLNEMGLKPLFHQLDISDHQSVRKLADDLKAQHGGIDLLINNAAIAFKNDATEPFEIQARETVAINYTATLDVCEALFPLLRPNAKVVNVSSSAGHLSRIPSSDLRAKFADPKLTIAELSKLMAKFVADAGAGRHKEEGWGGSAYVVSKVGLTALTIVQQRLFDGEELKRNVAINAVHPGYVDTDMTSHQGPLTIDEGAKAPLFLSLESDWKGKYVWFDSHVVNWYGDEVPAS